MKIALVVINSHGSVERVLVGSNEIFSTSAVSELVDKIAVPVGLPVGAGRTTVWRVPITEADSLDVALAAILSAKEGD